MFSLFLKLFSLLDNHYVLTYGDRRALTIHGKVRNFFSEIIFILLLKKVNNWQLIVQSIDITDLLSSISELLNDIRHEHNVLYHLAKLISNGRR